MTPPIRPPAKISLEKAAKAYGPRVLLDGVSLGVGERQRIGVVGRNGAGKSTLAAILAGAVQPDSAGLPGRPAFARVPAANR